MISYVCFSIILVVYCVFTKKPLQLRLKFRLWLQPNIFHQRFASVVFWLKQKAQCVCLAYSYWRTQFLWCFISIKAKQLSWFVSKILFAKRFSQLHSFTCMTSSASNRWLSIARISSGLFYLVVALWDVFHPTGRADCLYHVLQNMLISKLSGKKLHHNDVILVFLVSYTYLHKIRSRQPRDLKLRGLLAYIQFHKIWDFQIPTRWNDVMMTSSLCFLKLSIKRAKDNLQHWNFAGW